MDISLSHPSDRANFARVDIGDFTFYFSYSTIVAYRAPEEGLVTSENVWPQTTAKHLNFIQPNKARRIAADEFQAKLQSVLRRVVAV